MPPTFQERIKSTLKQLYPNDTTGVAAYDKVLDEFVETLTAEEPFLGATIEKGRPPQMRSFVTWPRFRPDQRSIMLTFWWQGTTLRVMNERKRPPFSTPEELSEYLLDFLKNSAFREALSQYEERCKEPGDGFLRTGGLRDAGADDVMVEVSAEDQQRLAEAKPGDRLELYVRREPVAGTAEYDTTRHYSFFYSGGFGIRVGKHELADGSIRLSGEVVNPATG